MRIRYELASLKKHPPSRALVKFMASDVGLSDGNRMRLGDFLGRSLAQSIVTSVGVPALSVYCFDERNIFGEFRARPPAIWLADKLRTKFRSNWTAEGYGTHTEDGCAVARWIAWDSAASEEDEAEVYRAISATFKMKEHMMGLDPLLARHFLALDPQARTSAAFIAVVARDDSETKKLMKATKEAIFDYLESCMASHP